MASHNGTATEDPEFAAARERALEREGIDPDAAAGWLIEGGNPYGDDRAERALDLSQINGRPFDECPDVLPEGRFDVDAQLVVGRRLKNGRMSQSGLRRIHIGNYGDLQRLREATKFRTGDPDAEQQAMREWNWSPDPFAYGSDQAVPGAGGGVLGQYIPLWPGPVTRQLYWQDYFAMSAKAFEAYNHDPVSWRAVHLKQEFSLGKGLQARATFSSGSKSGQSHDRAQATWQEFWDRNKMNGRLDMLARDLSWGGEQFLRYFKSGRLLTVRSLDPASIYDLITDPEDLETVFAYHQQFQAPYQLYPPKAGTPPTGVQSPYGATQIGSATRYIIRQILPGEVDHYRINCSAFERRGRSDLFPALGWIKRLRDYLTAHVIRADLLSRVCWDLQVKGNQATVSATRAQMFPNGQAPPPGSVFGHNEASTLSILGEGLQAGGPRFDPVLDALATMVSNSIGLPKDWLGFGLTSTRASALVATEPAARSLEELQGTLEEVIQDCFGRVMAAAKITDADLEVTFPSIATEDRSDKLKDLAFMESMSWIAHQTAASMGAKEMGITSYDAEEEMNLIASEFPEPETEDVPDGEPDPITGKKPQRPKQGDGEMRRIPINNTYRQVPKVDVTKSPKVEDLPPGLLENPDTGAPVAPEQPGLGGGGETPPPAPAGPQNGAGAATGPASGGRGRLPGSENPLSAAGASKIRAENAREAEPSFTLSQVQALMREAAKDRRRRPDDPAFLAASQRYRSETAQNLAELVRAAGAKPTTPERGGNE